MKYKVMATVNLLCVVEIDMHETGVVIQPVDGEMNLNGAVIHMSQEVDPTAKADVAKVREAVIVAVLNNAALIGNQKLSSEQEGPLVPLTPPSNDDDGEPHLN